MLAGGQPAAVQAPSFLLLTERNRARAGRRGFPVFVAKRTAVARNSAKVYSALAVAFHILSLRPALANRTSPLAGSVVEEVSRSGGSLVPMMSSQAKAPRSEGGSIDEEFPSRSSRGTAATTSFDVRNSPGALPAVPEDGTGATGPHENVADGLARAKAALRHRASGKKHITSPSHGFWGCGLLGLGSPNRVQPATISSFSERMVTLLVRSSLDLFYVTSDDGDLLFASVTVASFLGFTSEELGGCAALPLFDDGAAGAPLRAPGTGVSLLSCYYPSGRFLTAGATSSTSSILMSSSSLTICCEASILRTRATSPGMQSPAISAFRRRTCRTCGWR